MSEDISDEISIRIDERRSDLSDASEKPSIFKIHGQLRSENEEAYEPKVVSIGPYHHGKRKLKEMEKHKLRYLTCAGGESAEEYNIALANLQDQARRCYAEEISLSEDDFVDMLCLDGCFVIEFLRKNKTPESHTKNDPIFQMDWLQAATENDLILFENQLPFFVLRKLFDMTKSPGEEENLIDLAIDLPLWLNLPDPGLNSHSMIFKHYKPVHLLGLKHKILSASFSDETLDSTTNSNGTDSKLFLNQLVSSDKVESSSRRQRIYMSNPTETSRCISDYITFMDFLIDSPSDVETLRSHDIIVNGLGSDEALSTMFNKLSKYVYLGGRFCYTEIFDDVDKYSRKRWHIWRAYLVRKYFNNPWSFIAVLAACALLLLAIVQAIFSILQYTKQK
ncbi:UPF0481 protein At3g47200-like [Coffea arabica]|uniref:UPF0481 protein At3g47200-like n=1 Tax=Coffea arabica TaxID=13443 RepID=A0ABM4X4Q5_COFAR